MNLFLFFFTLFSLTEKPLLATAKFIEETEETTPQKGCDYFDNKCKPGIAGKCTDDDDCKKRCNGKKCEAGGTGHFCSNPKDCEETNCDGKGKCVVGAVGKSCTSDVQCDIKSCLNGRCVLGSDWGQHCNFDSECKEKRCSLGGHCMLGGLGPPCKSESECIGKTCKFDYIRSKGWVASCNEYGGSGGSSCNSDEDCPLKICKDRKCTSVNPNDPAVGLGRWCQNDSQCTEKRCVGSTCQVGGLLSGPKCEKNEECKLPKCNSNGKCSLDTIIGPLCKNDSQCSHYGCLGKRACGIIYTPGLDTCLTGGKPDDSKCNWPEKEPEPKKDMSGKSSIPLMKARKALSEARKAPIFGNPTAPISIVVFQDLKCGMCKKSFQEFFTRLEETYLKEGKVNFTFREFPLGLRSEEVKLAVAARCAHQQGKYLSYIRHLYQNMRETTPEQLPSYAQELGMDIKKFQICLQKPEELENVRADYKLGTKLKVTGTPTFFVNGMETIGGALSFQEFSVLLDSELKKIASTN